MAQDIKNEEVEEVQEEEVVETVEETTPEKSELDLANERAEEFENKYLRAHAEMQNIQRRANEERQNLQRYRSQDLAKAILPSLDNLERALAVEGLTDDVKKGLEMVQESLIHALKEEESKKSQLTVNLTITTIWPSKLSQQTMNTQQIPSPKFSKKATNSMTVSYAQPW